MESILVVDDDIELCALLKEYLHPEGFAVVSAHDGSAGMAEVVRGNYALVVLDVMLPEKNGLDVLREVRAHCSVPVIMLTACGEEVDRIVGLELGADDYLPKPFNPRELVARIRAVLRRVQEKTVEIPHLPDETIEIGDVLLDPCIRKVTCNGINVTLTAVEFALLHLLLREAGQVVSREQLAREVLGRELSLFDRSIDVHVSSLRKKLGRHVEGVERITTIRNVGYLYSRFHHGGGSHA